MNVEHARTGRAPFFSICIPQYNRTDFLIQALESVAEQTFSNVEICISDDCSNDGKEHELIAALRSTGLAFVYRRQATNKRYDGNLRSAIDMSRGRYCLLMGNDDKLSSNDELQLLHDDIVCQAGDVGVAITNFYETSSGRTVRRMPWAGNLGVGPRIAAKNFRNFSFVSGIVLHGELARSFTTDRWDGSEMYQMYIGTRIIASGLPLLSISRVSVHKDIHIPGQVVDAYKTKPRLDPCPIVERKHTLHLLAPLVASAIAPYVTPSAQAAVFESVIRQILLFTYPYWILEFRRVQSWNYAAGVCLGMRPKGMADLEKLTRVQQARVLSLYAASTLAGLTLPIDLFDGLRPFLYRLAKSGRGVVSAKGSEM